LVVRISQRHGVNQRDVPFHQRGKGLFGAFTDESFQQPGVGQITHSLFICAPPPECDQESFFEEAKRLNFKKGRAVPLMPLNKISIDIIIASSYCQQNF